MRFEFLTEDFEPCPTDQAPVFFGFECPKHPGHMCTDLTIRSDPADPGVAWTWDGNRQAPTFSPSIDCHGCSHGFIEAGIWRNA